jgi:hypothetical protein
MATKSTSNRDLTMYASGKGGTAHNREAQTDGRDDWQALR